MISPRMRLAIPAYAANDRRVNGDLRALPNGEPLATTSIRRVSAAGTSRLRMVEVTQDDMGRRLGRLLPYRCEPPPAQGGQLSWPAHQLARMRSGGPRRRPSFHHKSSAAGDTAGGACAATAGAGGPARAHEAPIRAGSNAPARLEHRLELRVSPLPDMSMGAALPRGQIARLVGQKTWQLRGLPAIAPRP